MTYHINVIDHEGSPHKIEATVGFSIMEIIINSPNLYVHLYDAVLFVQYLVDGFIEISSNIKF